MWIWDERPQRSRILFGHWNKDGGLIGEEHMIGATKIHSWNATLIWYDCKLVYTWFDTWMSSFLQYKKPWHRMNKNDGIHFFEKLGRFIYMTIIMKLYLAMMAKGVVS